MHTLPQPIRLSFTCSDRNGHVVRADVVASKEANIKPWVWRAVFHDTGEPPAELMGATERLDNIQADISARVSSLQVVGVIAPSTKPGPAAIPASAAAEVAAVLRVASRAEQVQRRSTNLAEVVRALGGERAGGMSLVSQVLGVPEADLWLILHGSPMSDEVAKEIEWAANKPAGWMDGAHELEPTP